MAEMNAALANTSTPFGKVAAPLKFRREAIETVAGPADNCPANTVSTHLARLILPSGKPLAYLLLHVLPDAFWQGLTGLPGAAEHPSVRSFLQLCVALAQLALLPALGFYRLWYRT